MLVLISLIILVWLLIQTTFIQNVVVHQVTRKLSRDLNTTVEIKHVDLDLFNTMLLEGTLIKDKKNDTLLYAGTAKVLITDWFFFKDKVELEYVGLKEATIHLDRTDSVWNYQFLIDYFSAPSSNKQQKNIDLKLKQLEFDNVAIIQKDGWRGENLSAVVKSLDVVTDSFDLTSKRIRIRTISLDHPSFAIHNYTGNRAPRPSVEKEYVEYENDPNNLRWNAGKWFVTIGKLDIRNGSFRHDVETDRDPYPYFDGQHMLFSGINGQFDGIRFDQDSITAKVSLATKERSGFVVKELKANMRMHPEAMEFFDLDLRTNNSRLTNFFAMRYNSFDDMSQFISSVRMEGNFDKAEINSDDIAFFAPDVKEWKKRIRVTGSVKGSVDNLDGQNLSIEAGTDTYLNGDISIDGLPDIDQTYIDFVARDFQTVYGDMIRFVPQLRRVTQPRLDQLRFVKFRGNFTGFLSDFVSYGTFQTNLGVVTTDLNMKVPKGGQASYSGTLRTQRFHLGRLIGNDQIGMISLNGAIKGRGLNASTMTANMDGTISLLEFRGYPYQNINVKGELSKNHFSGQFDANDPNLQASLAGTIDFTGKVPLFNVEANVAKTNLLALRLMNEDIAFNGKFNLDFSGNNIDNFLGTARIYEATLLRNGTRMLFDSLVLESRISEGQKMITAVSNEFDAALVGQFSIMDLPNSFRGFLQQYYPSYISRKQNVSKNENFSFVVTTKNVSDYMRLVQKDISGLNYSSITGRINTAENLLDLNVDVPQLMYGDIAFNNIQLKAVGNYDSLAVETRISNVIINDSFHFPDTYVKLTSSNDISDVRVTTSANQALNAANISAEIQTLTSGARIRFNESSFDLNAKTWYINRDGELILTKDLVSADDIRIYNGQQEIEVTTVPSDIGNTQDIKVQLTKINIGDFTPFFMPQNRLEGLLSGSIDIIDPFGKLKIDANTEAEQFRFEDDSIGLVRLTGFYNKQTNNINFTAKSDNEDYDFDVSGLFAMKDSSRSERIGIDVDLNGTRIGMLEKYLSGVFTNLDGFANGKLRIEGPTNDLDYLGQVQLQEGKARVKFTNVEYTIPSATFKFLEDRIDFGSFNLRDTFGNIGQIRNGKLYHRGFDDLNFDITFNTSKLLVLATENNGTDAFYGNVIARANMTLDGPLENLVMNISGEAADSSSFYLTNRSSRESGVADFVVWKVYGREMQPVQRSQETNLTINLDIVANNYVNMYVIMDEVTGDVIRANGHGNLLIHFNTNGEMTMTGRYDIDRGNYNFSFESLLKKPFRLREGQGNYILWTGDPLNARMKVEAEYEAENVKFSDLGFGELAETASSGGGTNAPSGGGLGGMISNNVRNYRGKMLVIANLTGDLMKPDIKFGLELPANSPLRNDLSATSLLSQIELDENELTKQVAFLIVFNSFAPMTSSNSQANIPGAAFEGLVVGSISGVLSNVLSRQFSSVLQDIFNDKSINVNFNAQLYSGTNFLGRIASNNPFSIDRTNLNFSINKRYLNDRLSFTFGSAMDFGLTSAQANTAGNLPFLPDITAEWKLTPDGRLLLTFFYRDSYNYLGGTTGGRQNRTGASISYRKDFEHMRDLFRKRNKLER